MIDSKDLGTVEGFDIRAVVDYDNCILRPDEEYDCYDDETVKAWERDDWTFTVLKVSAIREGIELGVAYLAGCEYGWMPTSPGTEPIFISPFDETDYIEDLTAEAVSEAKDTIAKLTAA